VVPEDFILRGSMMKFIALTQQDYSDMMSLNGETREENNERTPQSGYPHIRETQPDSVLCRH
jgi:hypothetical protein